MIKRIFTSGLFRTIVKPFIYSEQDVNRDNIIATKTVFVPGNWINDIEVESRVECFLYASGKVLSKCYFGEWLYMISISKDGGNIFNSATV